MPRLEPPPTRFNMAHYCLGAGPPRDPDKTGFILVVDADRPDQSEHWTYAALDEAVRRTGAGLLAARVRPGERLVIALSNTGDYLLLFFGAIAAGIVPLPASSLLTPAEIEFLIADAEPAAVALAERSSIAVPHGIRVLRSEDIAAIRAAPPLPRYADTARDDPAFLIYTSGTSRRPKGVLHAQRSVWGRRPTYAGWSGIGADDVLLHAGAFNWSYTLSAGLADPWANGATAVLYSGPRDPSVWVKLIGGTGATLFAAVPGIYRQMLKQADIGRTGIGRLRHGLVAGEALPPSVLAEWRTATGLELYEAFGMSECSTFISNRPGLPIRPGSPGQPQAGRRIAALPVDGGTEARPQGETGLLAVHRSDPGLMLGYWRRPEEDAAAFRGDWFVSGDLVSVDGDGYVWFHGRADDVMNAGGFRVSPLEVEAALAGHPAVAEVAAAEHEIRDGVRIIAAWIVPKPDAAANAALAREIVARGSETLAVYKRPREVFFVEALPRTSNGKVARRLLSSLEAAPVLGRTP
ncbi:MAG TPA: AMP-binding protein [Bauldia sp.]|nr:AMP-binding protein [Bauldia sp.]